MNRFFVLILLCLSLLTSYSTYSQEYDLTWGPEFPLKGKAASPMVIGAAKEKVFVLKSDVSKTVISYYIDVYDEKTLKSLNRILFKNILPSDFRSHSIARLMLIGDRLILLSLSTEGNLFASIIGLEGNLIRSQVRLDNFGQKGSDFESCIISVSPDDSKILVIREMDGKKKENTEYSFILYDTAFNQLISKKTTLPYARTDFSFIPASVLIDNRGNAYFAAYVKIQETWVEYKKVNTYKSVLMSFSLGSPEPEFNEINLSLGQNIGTSFLLHLDDNSLNITGLYASSSEATFLDGFFHLELDKKSYLVKSLSFNPLQKEHLNRVSFTS